MTCPCCPKGKLEMTKRFNENNLAFRCIICEAKFTLALTKRSKQYVQA